VLASETVACPLLAHCGDVEVVKETKLIAPAQSSLLIEQGCAEPLHMGSPGRVQARWVQNMQAAEGLGLLEKP